MKIYKKNIGYFLNAIWWTFLFFHEPFWEMVKYMGPSSLILPLLVGALMGYWERDIDWEQV